MTAYVQRPARRSDLVQMLGNIARTGRGLEFGIILGDLLLREGSGDREARELVAEILARLVMVGEEGQTMGRLREKGLT
jgi:hypothetical protein